MLATFLAAERGHRAWAGVFLALTVAVSTAGRGADPPAGDPDAAPGRLATEAVDAVARCWGRWRPLAFLGYIATVTGSTTAFLDAQQAWGRTGIGER